MNALLRRAIAACPWVALVLAGVLSIVGSGTPVPAPCKGELSLSIEPASVAEGMAAELRLEATQLPGTPVRWDLTWLATRSDGSAEQVHRTQVDLASGDLLDTYTVEPTVYSRDNGTHYSVSGTFGCFHGGSEPDALWTATTVSADLSVIATAPSWVSEPADQSVKVGQRATFSASALGDISYQWESSSDGFASATPIAGATGESYTTAATTLADQGTQYRVRATGRVTGQVIVSRSATLSVADDSLLPPSFDAAIRAQPIAVTAGSVAIAFLDVTQVHGTASNVDLALTGAPVGLSLTPASIFVLGDVAAGYVLNVAADAAIAPGSYAAMLHLSRAGAVLKDLNLQVTVVAAPRNVGLQAIEPIVVMVPSRVATARVTATPIVGSAATVTVQARGLPSGLSVVPTERAFTADPAGLPVELPFPMFFAADTPLGVYGLEFVATEGASSALTSLSLDYRAEATVSVDAGGDVHSASTIVPLTAASDGSLLNANLVRGELGLLAPNTSAPSRPAVGTFLGAPTPLQLINTRAAAVQLPAGSLRLELDGSYILADASALHLQADFALRSGAGAAESPAGRVDHAVGNGGVTPVTTATGDMAITVARGDASGLRATMSAPAMVLAPGQTLDVTASLRLLQADRNVRIDFLTVPVRLCLNLPSGVELANNSLIPMNWCH